MALDTSSLTSVLQALYEATDGAAWSSSTGWLASDVCAWSGITCDGSALDIRLAGRGLRGELPTEIGSLGDGQPSTFAVDIALNSNNMLTDTLPTELGAIRASSLDIDLHYSAVSGTIPSEVGRLTMTGSSYGHIDLGLRYTPISGTLPTEFGRMSAEDHTILDLNDARLSGTVPSE